MGDRPAAELQERFWLESLSSGRRLTWSDYVAGYKAGELQPDPGFLWEVRYDYEAIRATFGRDAIRRDAGGLSAWPLLPIVDPEGAISLGEGGTPLVPCRGPIADCQVAVYAKNESLNPTGSFKDRYDCVSVNVARRMGYRGVACASTGNHGLSVAAYAAAARLSCLAITSDRVSQQVLAALRIYGAEVVAVPPHARFELLAGKAEEGLFPIGLFMPGPTSNPFGVEGYKSIAFEIYDQMQGVPNAVLFPCARGNGLYGTWKGFLELRELGLADSLPRMYACQPKAAASLVLAFERGEGHPVQVQPGPSIADATCEAVSSQSALDALRTSGGGAVALEEEEVRKAVSSLGREGILAEPSSAMVWAGVEVLASRGEIAAGETAVAVVTSTGYKTSAATLAGIASADTRG